MDLGLVNGTGRFPTAAQIGTKKRQAGADITDQLQFRPMVYTFVYNYHEAIRRK